MVVNDNGLGLVGSRHPASAQRIRRLRLAGWRMPADTAKIAATLQRDNVIDFQPTGTIALHTTVAVALEDGAAYSGPAAQRRAFRRE